MSQTYASQRKLPPSPGRPPYHSVYDRYVTAPEYELGYRRRPKEDYVTAREVEGSGYPPPLRHVETLGNKRRIITQSQQPHVRPFYYPRVPQSGFAEYDIGAGPPPVNFRGDYEKAAPRLYNQLYPDDDCFASDSDSEVSDVGSDLSFNFDFGLDQNGSSASKRDPIPSGEAEKAHSKESHDAAKSRGTFNETGHRVLRSHYTGDAQARGEITAHLTAEQDSLLHPQSASMPLMSWIHLESQCPSFQEFLEHIHNVPGLSDEERQDAVALLQRSRETHERPYLTSEGSKGKYFEPCLDEEITISKNKQIMERKSQFLCLPYFSLAPYSQYSVPTTSPLHPTKTLLQYSYGSTSMKRDLEQAVCRLEMTKKGNCFHVPQIWCLILDNRLLVTCSRLSALEIQRACIDVELLPPSQGINKPTYLSISDGKSRTWLLPVKDCASWFGFTANFKDASSGPDFGEEYDLLCNGRVVGSDRWADFVSQLREESTRLVIRKKKPRYRSVEAPADLDSEPPTDDEDSKVVVSYDSQQGVEEEVRGGDQEENLASKLVTPVKETSESTKGWSNKPGSPEAVEASTSDFHYFLWLTAASPLHSEGSMNNRNNRKFCVQMEKLNNLVNSMHNFLCSTKSRNRAAYKRCPSRTLAEVESLIEATKIEVQQVHAQRRRNDSRPRGANSESRSRSRDRRERSVSRSRSRVIGPTELERVQTLDKQTEKEMFLKTAKKWFLFFFPLHYHSKLIFKYWGAVYHILEDEQRFKSFAEDYPFYTEALSVKIGKFRRNLSEGRGPLPWDVTFAEEFGKAWLHILMYFVLSGADQTRLRRSAENELRRAEVLLTKGHKLLLRNAVTVPLPEREAVLPLGLVSLVARKLLEDVALGRSDICATYYDYFKKLEQEVQSNPYSRSHQEKLSYLHQEISTILNVLTDQHQVLSDLSSKIGSQSAIPAQYRFPKAREFYILRDCISSVQAKMQSFLEMRDLASDLGIFNIRRIESNKDRQEAAILVFTIVTIIFLPLSFVSSFLGMNTTDIRNTNSSQWLFWAIAIPVTVIVVALALILSLKVELARETWGHLRQRWTGSVERGATPIIDHRNPLSEVPRPVPEYANHDRRYDGWERQERDYLVPPPVMRRPNFREYA